MAAKNDWVDGQQVTAATMNALGTEVNTKASSAELSAAIGGRQPADVDLSTIAGLTATTDSFMQAKSNAWAARTVAQVKTDLGLTGTNSGDQDLSGLQPLDADLTALAAMTAPATKLAGIATGATANDTDANLKARANHTGTQAISTVTNLQSSLDAKEATANKGAANGYAPLDASSLVPAVNLPSYVDDVLEYANLAGFPGTGTTGKIFVALDTGKIYRWSGSAYVEISPSPGSTDSVTEGSSNLYYTNARADARITAATATGTGSLVRATSPALVTPALGTPASGNLANCTFPTLNQNTSGTAAVATKWVPRIGTTTSTATPSIDCALYEQYNVTALAANITGFTFTNVFDGCKLLIRITGTATRTIVWGSGAQSSGVATLLATTSGTNTHHVALVYDAVKAKMVCVAVDATGY